MGLATGQVHLDKARAQREAVNASGAVREIQRLDGEVGEIWYPTKM